MTKGRIFFGILLVIAFGRTIDLKSQSVPLGMNYQAVARDENGKELTQKSIDVKFTILSGSPVGTEVYQETYSGVVTSKYGVFSLIIGKGTKTDQNGPDISQVPWEQANQWVKVEIDFGKGFVNMGTMQFMAVPYAMFAYKSLEAGPIGPQGPPGDPASDKQTLGFDGRILTISNGNEVDLGTLNVPHSLTLVENTLSIYGGNSVTLPNQIQDLILDVNDTLKITNNSSATPISLSKYLDNTDNQGLSFNTGTNILSITGGTSADLSTLKQSLAFNPSTGFLSISGGNSSDLSTLKLPLAFNQLTSQLSINGGTAADISGLKVALTFSPSTSLLSVNGGTPADLGLLKLPLAYNSSTGLLSINGGTAADLSSLKQTISYNPSTYTLSLTNGGSATLISTIAFRTGINATYTLPNNTLIDLVFDQTTGSGYFNDGANYNTSSGYFQAGNDGIYTFTIAVSIPSATSAYIKLNGSIFETLLGPTSTSGFFRGTITMKLTKNDIVTAAILQTNGFTIIPTITGSFSGFRVY
jgi:hypothetical protein